jgi:hypothetical protein
MTAIATPLASARSTAGATRRIWNVVRLQYANRFNMVVLPWMILAFVFVINLAIWIIITNASDGKASLGGTQYSGSTFYIFIYLGVAAVQAVNLTFPFALGYSVTRKDYYLGTVLAFVLQSALFTVAYVLLSYIEEWTNGWGVGGHMFSGIYFGQGALWQRLFTVFAAFLVCFFIGVVCAAVYVRWKANGLYVLGAAFAVVLVGALALITFTKSWVAVGTWFAATGATGLVAWLLIPTALAAILGYLILRRATPRS